MTKYSKQCIYETHHEGKYQTVTLLTWLDMFSPVFWINTQQLVFRNSIIYRLSCNDLFEIVFFFAFDPNVAFVFHWFSVIWTNFAGSNSPFSYDMNIYQCYLIPSWCQSHPIDEWYHRWKVVTNTPEIIRYTKSIIYLIWPFNLRYLHQHCDNVSNQVMLKWAYSSGNGYGCSIFY